MRDFASRDDAASRLAAAIASVSAELVVSDEQVVCDAMAGTGRVAALAVVERTDDGAVVLHCPCAPTVIVALVGVETGRTAAALAAHLRTAGAERIVLAAAVLPRQSRSVLGDRFDDYVALVSPLAPRDMRWHIG